MYFTNRIRALKVTAIAILAVVLFSLMFSSNTYIMHPTMNDNACKILARENDNISGECRANHANINITSDTIGYLNSSETGTVGTSNGSCAFEQIDDFKSCSGITLSQKVFTGLLNITNLFESCDNLPFLDTMRNPCFYEKDRSLSCLPYFHLLAPQKSATNDVYASLTSHPQIRSLPGKLKEHDWFGRHRFGIYETYKYKTLKDYMQPFSRVFRGLTTNSMCAHASTTVVGDASASTLWDNQLWRLMPENENGSELQFLTPHFIKRLNPNAKFIAVLRDPTERLWSDYNFYITMKNRIPNAHDFHMKIAPAITWMEECLSDATIPDRACLYDEPFKSRALPRGYHPDISWQPVVRLRVGLYSEYLRDWLSVFHREQFYFTTLNEYSSNKRAVLKNISKFLELQSYGFSSVQNSLKLLQTNSHARPMLQQTKRLLDTFYGTYNAHLAKLLDSDEFYFNF